MAVAVGAVLSGVGIGIWLSDETGAQETQTTTGAVPQECLRALDEAEDRLRLRNQAPDLAERYREVLRRGAIAIRSFDTERLEELLVELEDLNARLDTVLEEAEQGSFQAYADRCRALRI